MAKRKTPADLTTEYEKILYRQQKALAKTIEGFYEELITALAAYASVQTMPVGVFELRKLPGLNALVDRLIKKLNDQVLSTMVNGVESAWALSNKKNDFIFDIRLKDSIISKRKQAIFYDPNKKALEQFLDRKVKGLNLSQRIYKKGKEYKAQLEAGLGEGIGVGRSAADLGRSLKEYLRKPDKLYRRVRDAEDGGKLKLSRRAKAYHPGKGVYRSATKNIERLTRTETNMAYRSADNARYQATPFIIGYEVKLSTQHPRYDICDSMKGRYPVGFVFTGWHPQCLCFSVPVLMNQADFIKYQRLVLAGEDTPENVAKITDRVITIPDSASKWIKDNTSRVAGWKSTPLWWQQNPTFVPKIQK